jgi:hypothetical protein
MSPGVALFTSRIDRWKDKKKCLQVKIVLLGLFFFEKPKDISFAIGW